MEKMKTKDLKTTLSWILELANCPICTETLQPTTAQCINGHPFCLSCKLKLNNDECPLCRSAFSNVQPTGFIHQVIEALPHPCRHQNCKYFVQTNDDHEKFCIYKTTSCRYCEWTGPGHEILLHLQTQHPDTRPLLETCSRSTLKPFGIPFDPSVECSKFTPLFVCNQFFWIEMKNEPQAKKLTAIIHTVPNEKTHFVFYAHVELKLRKESYNVKTKLNMDPGADPYQENCMSIPTSLLHKFTDNHLLKYRVFIVADKWKSISNIVHTKLEMFKK